MTLTKEIAIVIVEDHKLMSTGLKLMLQQIPGFQIVGEAYDGKSAVQSIVRMRPDVVLMDIGLPDIDGIDVTYQIKFLCPHTKVIMLTSHQSEEDVLASLGAGANGYCLKDSTSAQLESAIRTVDSGGNWLDPELERCLKKAGSSVKPPNSQLQEIEDLDLLCFVEQGLSNAEIAKELSVSVETVKVRLRKIFETLFLSELIPQRLQKTAQRWRKQLAAHVGDAVVEGEKTTTQILSIGETFAGKYQIKAVIGRGGMGRVYKAVHIHMDRLVAIKVLLPQFAADRRVIRFFQDEAKAASTLLHPNIVQIFDFGITADGQAFLVMDYIDGVALDTVLRSEVCLNRSRFFSVFLQICDALIEAHEKSVIHCDLKPSNIILTQNGTQSEFVKIIDFGLAKTLPPAKAGVQGQLTDSFEVCGSPSYMSPEQCRGTRMDWRTDLYSLGCTMYEALTGHQAINGATAMECVSMHLEDTPLGFDHICPERKIPKELEHLVFKLLAKNPEHRIQSAQDLKTALECIRAQQNYDVQETACLRRSVA